VAEELYTGGGYLEKNPLWHVEESPWKAKLVMQMMARHNLAPQTICEVGCGAGEVLKQLQDNLPQDCSFFGYDISPQAIDLCRSRANERLHFVLGDIKREKDVRFDLMLVLDVIEHLEDYFSFLREIRPRSPYKILQIPLDLSVQTVLRSTPLIRDRKQFGHIHYFNKETALQTLTDVGYEVLDYFYAAVSLDLPSKQIRNIIMRLPRRICFAIHKDIAVRILGGYRIMVLAK
jgi:SAM-dependent methyltransferase